MSHDYNKVLYYYKKGFWSKSKVHDAVGRYITAEEYEMITGEPYEE